ncbi:MAG: hypothetical protein HC903_08300 [Methylacidiphilales bacterium]|nr:hypothetical protein [Candidatus Methylacidiphilales bacterium]
MNSIDDALNYLRSNSGSGGGGGVGSGSGGGGGGISRNEIKQATDSLDKYLIKQGRYIQATKERFKDVKRIKDRIPGLEKAAKVGQDLKKLLDKTLFKQVAPSKAGQLLNGLSQIATAGFIAFGAKTAEEVQMYDLQNQSMVQNDLNRQLNLTLKQNARVTRLEKETNANSQALNVLSGAVGEVKIFTYRELTNLQTKFDSQLGKVPLLQQQIDTFASKFQTYDDYLTQRINVLGSQIKILRTTKTPTPVTNNQNQDAASKAEVNQLKTRVTKVEKDVKGINLVPLTNKVNQIFNGTASAINRLNQLQKEIPGIILRESTKLFNEELVKLKPDIDKKLDRDRFPDELIKQAILIIGIAKPVIYSTIKPYADATITIQSSISNLTKDVANNTRVNDKQNQDIAKTFLDIDKIRERIGEQEKVNDKGNRQLEDLLKLTILLPPLIGKIPDLTTAKIKPLIPTPGQITKSIPTPTCRFTEEGIKSHVTSDGTFSRARNEAYHIAELAIAKIPTI